MVALCVLLLARQLQHQLAAANEAAVPIQQPAPRAPANNPANYPDAPINDGA